MCRFICKYAVAIVWQSCGNRVAVLWQSSGNRTIPEMGTICNLCRGVLNNPGSGWRHVPKDVCANTGQRFAAPAFGTNYLPGGRRECASCKVQNRIIIMLLFYTCMCAARPVHLHRLSSTRNFICHPPQCVHLLLHLSLRFMTEVLIKLEGNLRAVRRRRTRYSSRVSFLLAGHRFSWSLMRVFMTDHSE